MLDLVISKTPDLLSPVEECDLGVFVRICFLRFIMFMRRLNHMPLIRDWSIFIKVLNKCRLFNQ